MLTCELFPIRKNSGASSAITKELLFVYRECSFPKAQRAVKNIMQSFLTALNFSSLLSYSGVSFPLLMAFPWQLPMLNVCNPLGVVLPHCCLWREIKQKSTAFKCNQCFCFIKLHVKPLWPLLCSFSSLVLCCGFGQHSYDFSYLFPSIKLMASLHFSYMSNSQQLYPPVFTSHWSKATKGQNKWWHWITDMCMSFAWSKRTSLFDSHELPWLAEIENYCIFMICGGKEKLPGGPQKFLSSLELKNTTTPTQLLQLHPSPHLLLQRTSL